MNTENFSMKKSKALRETKTPEELISKYITKFSLLGKSFSGKKGDELNAEKSFYGRLFLPLEKIMSKELDAAFGVSFKDGNYVLYYNPEYLLQCDENNFFYFLKHEGMHLINKHLIMLNKILKYEADEDKINLKEKLYNLATDMYINFNANLPKKIYLNNATYELIFPEDYDLPRDKNYSSDKYFLELLKRRSENEQRSNDDRGSSGSEENTNFDQGTDDRNNEVRSKNDDNINGKNIENNNSSSEENTNKKHNEKSDDKNQKHNEKSDDKNQKHNEKSDDKNQKHNEKSGDKNKESGCESGQKNNEKTSGLNSNKDLLSNHDFWGVKNVEAENMTQANIKLQKNVREILTDMRNKKTIGNLPNYLTTICEDLLGTPQFPYYQIIHNLIRASIVSKFKRSSTRLNKKKIYSFILNKDMEENKTMLPTILPYPGKVKDYSFNVVIIVDTSASMNIDEMKESLIGARSLLENDKHTKITVIEVDAKIQKEYEIKRISDIDPKFKGRGGTFLTPALKRARELKPDVTLIFTDGHIENLSAENIKAYPKKMIWIISKNGIIDKIKRYGHHVKIP